MYQARTVYSDTHNSPARKNGTEGLINDVNLSFCFLCPLFMASRIVYECRGSARKDRYLVSLPVLLSLEHEHQSEAKLNDPVCENTCEQRLRSAYNFPTVGWVQELSGFRYARSSKGLRNSGVAADTARDRRSHARRERDL